MIDEKKLLKEIQNKFDLGYGEILINPNEFYNMVEEQPKINNGWISVKERLPESKDDSVLAQFSNGSIETVHIQDYFDDITAGIDENGNQLYTKWYLSQGVIAWQPLPEPYKEASKD